MVGIKNVRRRRCRRNKNVVAVVLTLLSRTLLGYWANDNLQSIITSS